MTVMVEFMKTMFVNGTGLAVWISLLLAADMVVPLVFITTVEAQLVLAAAIAGAVTQTAILASRGFVRLLGIGHIYWVPLIPWLLSRLDGFPPAGPFAMWLTLVAGERLGEDLQGDLAVELGIGGLIDLAHAAFADLGGDGIGAEAGADGQGHEL